MPENAMEAKELYSIPIASLVVAPFASQWSEDNHLYVVTEKGVHIFELVPSPTCPHPSIEFSRSFIYPSEVLPAKEFASDVNFTLWKMNREEIYSLLMEDALTPEIDGVADMIPRIISAAWSPQQLLHPYRCLLATVTSAGAVEILFEVSTNWLSAYDLSTRWLDVIRKELQLSFTGNSDKNVLHNILVKNLRRLQATAIVWSELYKTTDTCFAYLVIAYRSSDIVVWKIPKMAGYSEDIEPVMVFKTIINTDVKITMLKWIPLEDNEYLIVIGYFNGQIHGLRLKQNRKNIILQSLQKYYDYSDNIDVSCIKILNRNNYGVKLLVSKGSFLILLNLNLDGILMDIQHLRIEGFSITGLAVISSNQALITTQDATLFAIKVEEQRLISERVKHDLTHSHVQYLGLSSSPNRTLLLNVTSPDSIHDHLITREPSIMNIFSLEGKQWDPLCILNENASKSLINHWDCLESIRIKAAKASDQNTTLSVIPQDLELLSIYELRLAMWISIISEVCKKKKSLRRIENIVGEISEAQPLIFVHSASALIIRLVSKQVISKEQRLCISLLRLRLEVYLAGEEDDENTPVSRRAREALNLSSKMNSIETEYCDLCGEIINELSWTVVTCPKGHIMPRCAITLLQVSMIQYRSCPICGQIFHPLLDEEFEEPQCLFCDVPGLYDSRVFDINNKAGLPIRNLSVRRLPASQASRVQGTEKSIGENLKEESSDSRAFTIIIKNEEDEQYGITETWQEF